MELIVTAGERQATLEVEAEAAGGYTVRLEDRCYRVDRATAASGPSSLLVRETTGLEEGSTHSEKGFPPPGPQRQWEVSVRRRDEGTFAVCAAGPLPEAVVTVMDPLTHRANAALAASGRTGPHRATAYMPGRVIALLVEEGSEVSAGQGVLVLEAMKMENEIAAESAGVVRRILVQPGEAVDSGDPLFEIE